MLDTCPILSPRKMIHIAQKLFATNPARVIIDDNTLIAGRMKITFINENNLIIKIDNQSINITL